MDLPRSELPNVDLPSKDLVETRSRRPVRRLKLFLLLRMELRFRRVLLLSASFTAVFSFLAFTVFTLAELNFADAAIADGAAASTVKALAAIKACVIICLSLIHI